MKTAEFEEREYEATLYNQLQRRGDNIWAPGQVLEARVGFDYALHTSHPYFWRLQGFLAPPLGVTLGMHPSDFWWNGRRFSHPLPDFSLNLFIQAKRPYIGSRAPKHLAPLGFKGPFWKFILDQSQQRVLEALAKSTSGQALVSYASGAFHRVTELWAHSRNGSIVETSTFPTALSLQNHEAWYYNTPGCIGFANPNPEPIDDLPLLQRIAEFTRQRTEVTQGQNLFIANLKRLATSVGDAIKDASLGETSRTAVYFESLRLLDRYSDIVESERYSSAVRNYLIVAVFVSVFQLQWYVLGRSNV